MFGIINPLHIKKLPIYCAYTYTLWKVICFSKSLDTKTTLQPHTFCSNFKGSQRERWPGHRGAILRSPLALKPPGLEVNVTYREQQMLSECSQHKMVIWKMTAFHICILHRVKCPESLSMVFSIFTSWDCSYNITLVAKGIWKRSKMRPSSIVSQAHVPVLHLSYSPGQVPHPHPRPLHRQSPMGPRSRRGKSLTAISDLWL